MMHLIECTLSELFTAVNPSQGLCWECRQGVPQLLRRLKLSHGQVKVESTPRRLVVIVERVQAKQEDAEERVRGPPAKVRRNRRWHHLLYHASPWQCSIHTVRTPSQSTSFRLHFRRGCPQERILLLCPNGF